MSRSGPFREQGPREPADLPAASAGFGLAEMLVAAAVFAMVVAVALALYSVAAKSYRIGEQLTAEQQNVRTAFDRMTSEIRLAGLNTNPDGDPNRTDEQIEGAWDTAVAFRADLDFGDPVKETVPELSLAPPNYRVVSTGNDEIVTYALAKPGPSGPGVLVFRLDADHPRSGVPKTISIPNLALVQDDPPYVLYRITLSDVLGSFPPSPQTAATFTYEPVAENIRSLDFQYFDHQGRPLGPGTPGTSSDDIGGDDSELLTRARIRSVRISLTGMLADAKNGAGDDRRPLAVSSLLRLENMGRAGMTDPDNLAPPAPRDLRPVAGHCGGLLLTWKVPEPRDAVTGFLVRYWPKGSSSTASTRRFPYSALVGSVFNGRGRAFVDGLAEGVTYCFQAHTLRATGPGSPWSPDSSTSCAQVSEASTPAAPRELEATGGRPGSAQEGEVRLEWAPVTTNTGLIEGDPDSVRGATVIRDLAAYKIYRSHRTNFVPDDTTNLLATVPAGMGLYSDRDVASCRSYYYKIVATDRCGVASVPGPMAEGRAETSVPPSAPSGLNARRFSRDQNALTWDPVRTDVNGRPIFVDQYKVYWYKTFVDQRPSDLDVDTFSLRAFLERVSSAYDDLLDWGDQSDQLRGWHFYYAVSAADRCGNESRRSVPVTTSCSEHASLVLSPADGDSRSGIVPIIVRPEIDHPCTMGRVQISRASDRDSVVYDHESTRRPFLFPAWDTGVTGPGEYRIHWELVSAEGCSTYETTAVTVKQRPGGGLETTTPSATAELGDRKLSWDLINTTGADLEISRIDVTWFSLGLPPALTAIEFPSGRVASSEPRGGPQRVSETFDAHPLRVPREADGLCADPSCRLSTSLVFDSPVFSSRTGNAERVTVRYYARDSTGKTRTAAIVVWPDLGIRMDRPAAFGASE